MRPVHVVLQRMQDDSVMVTTRLLAIALMVVCATGLAEARKRTTTGSPAHFLCENLKIGCVKKAARAKAKKPKKTLAVAKTTPKPAVETVAPAPVKPLPKPETAEPPKPAEPEQRQALVTPIKPVPKPGEAMGPPPAERPRADDGSACQADLVKLGADIEIPPAMVADTACVVVNPVALKSLRSPAGVISFPGRPVLNCIFARQFVTWLGDVAAPVVAAHEDAGLAALSTGPGFQCRGRNGDSSAKMSEHAFGNAIDIDAIIAGKKRIEIAAVADPTNPAYRLLMALRISACGYFTTVLGPGSNAAHATHYHFDLGIHGKSSNYRICE
jgi:hypothetical protein